MHSRFQSVLGLLSAAGVPDAMTPLVCSTAYIAPLPGDRRIFHYSPTSAEKIPRAYKIFRTSDTL